MMTVPRTSGAQAVAVRNMTFGTMLRGTTTQILPTNAKAAEWQISGLLILTSSITFTLPTTLNRVGGGGTLPITFCSTCGIYRSNNTNPVGGTTFNPNTGIRGLSLSLLSTIYFWMGATVNPGSSQATGTYTGSILMTVTSLL